MQTESIPFSEIYQQKLQKVKQLPLLPEHTTIISTTKHTGGVGLVLTCLIAAIKSASNKNFLFVNTTAPVVSARAFLAKFGGGVDVSNTPEKLWDANITSFIADNNLYISADTSGIPSSAFIGTDALNTDKPIIDYYFLYDVNDVDLLKLQRANPTAVFVVNRLIPEGTELIEFSSYWHSF